MLTSDELLENLRRNRLKSYQATPGDIEEHRRAELRVAGDTAGRPLIEIIQNADDAMNQFPNSLNNRAKVILENNRLVVANSGDPFTDLGVEAICNLDRSPKRDRRITIGNKGIGFKSVLTWSKKPIIHSKTFDFTFDRERSATEISQVLNANYGPEFVPLMRLPFKPGHLDNLAEKLYQEGFVTVIILPLRNEDVATSVLDELDKFDPLTLLFLHSLSDLLIITQNFERRYSVSRKQDKIIIDAAGKIASYKLFRDDKKIPDHISSSLPEDCQDLTHSSLSIAIPEKPLETYYELFSYFPTSERCPFKFFIHGDFILDAGRKHLRGDAKEYNEWVIKEIASLFADKALPHFGKNNPAVLDFLECRSPINMEPVEKQLFDSFVDVIGSTRFLPAMMNPSRLLSPQMAGLAREETINDARIMFKDEIKWAKRFLIEPEWAIGSRLETLKKFGGKEIKKPDFVKILASLARPDPSWCTDALRIILKWKAAAPPYSSDNESASDIGNALKLKKLFLTTKLELRSLSSNEAFPLFLPPAEGKNIDIPPFISLDFLNPDIGKDLEEQEAKLLENRLGELSNYGLHPFRAREIAEKAVLPAIKDAEGLENRDPDYKKSLLIFLAQLEPNENKFEDTDACPWFHNLRTQLALKICVQTEAGDWLPAWKVYAGKEWGAPDELIAVYKDSEKGRFLSSPNATFHNGIPFKQWKSLYRYLGVSWEPKILPIEKLPGNISGHFLQNPHPSQVLDEDWEQYKCYLRDDKSLSDMWRWSIELKESYVFDDWANIKNKANKCLNLLQLLYRTEAFNYVAGPEKGKVKSAFRYTKISYTYSASCYAYLIWGIKYSDWLPSTSAKLFCPSKIFLEDSEIGRALKGVVPVLRMERPKEKELGRRFEDIIDEIGIRRNWDQITIEDWRRWLSELSEMEGGLSKEHVRLAQNLYRHCLVQCNVPGSAVPFSEINVLSRSTGNQFGYRKAEEVVYLDKPRFDTIRSKLMDSGYSLFALELGGENRVKRAKDLFGMTLASEMIDEEVLPGEEDSEKTEEWRRRFKRLSPVLFARLSKDRPESRTKDEEFFRSLSLFVVKDLNKRFKLLDTEALLFEEKPPACWSSSDNTLYLNASSVERSLWSGLAESLAQRLGQTYYEAFENLLLCESDVDRIDKLRRAGVPEDDVLDCERTLQEELGVRPDSIGDVKGEGMEGDEPVKEEKEGENITEERVEEPVGQQILEAKEGVFGEEFEEKLGTVLDVIDKMTKVESSDPDVNRPQVDKRPTTPREVSREKKDKVESAAMNWVERYERDQNREPKDVSQYNLGYDIESSDSSSGEKRYIEVKGASGRPEKRGFTINEWRKANELGDKYYIYYVVGLGDAEGELRIFNDPASKIKPDEKAFVVKLSRGLADKIVPFKKKD